MQSGLSALLIEAQQKKYAVACFNVFGFEDAMAVVEAAENAQCGVILACNPDVMDFIGINNLLAMLKPLAATASVPVCIHLDHCYDPDAAIAAAHAGFDSVMYDGSQLSLQENILNTQRVVRAAHRLGVCVEGEIGSVPYSEGRDWIKSELTEPSMAEQFAAEAGLDAVAISIGNVHRLVAEKREVDLNRLADIAQKVQQPLVIHGATGLDYQDLQYLIDGGICKFNIGTALRKAFGQQLRKTLNDNPDEFDRVRIMRTLIPPMRQVAAEYIEQLSLRKQAVA